MRPLSIISPSNLFGFAALFWFASYIILPGGYAALPFLVVGLLSLAWLRFAERPPLRVEQRLWIVGLCAFGLFSILSLWYHEAESSRYEEPLIFLFAGFLASGLLRIEFGMKWLQAGVALGTISVTALAVSFYDGGRFAPTMNATKFGNAIAVQAALCVSLAAVTRTHLNKLLFLLLAALNLYWVVLTGTRGALLGFGLYLLLVVAVLLRNFDKRTALMGLVAVTLVVVSLSQSEMLSSRIKDATNDINRVLAGDYSGSIGARLMMYRVGIDAGLSAPIAGAGYNYEKVFESFNAQAELQQVVVSRIGERFNNFHSVYVDSFARKGIPGLIIVLSVFLAGAYSKDRRRMLLLLAPVVVIFGAGFSDSVFDLGITATTFAVATTFLRAVSIRDS